MIKLGKGGRTARERRLVPIQRVIALVLVISVIFGLSSYSVVYASNTEYSSSVTEAELANPVGQYDGADIFFIKVAASTSRLFFNINGAWEYIDKQSDFGIELDYDQTESKYYINQNSDNYTTAKADYESSVDEIICNAVLSDTADHLLIQIYYSDDSIAYVLVEWECAVIETSVTTVTEAELANPVGQYDGADIFFIKVTASTSRLFFNINGAWEYIDKQSDFGTELDYDQTESKYYIDQNSDNYTTAKVDYENSVDEISCNTVLSDVADHLLIQIYYSDDSFAYLLVEWAKSLAPEHNADKSALEAEIARVTDGIADFHHYGSEADPDDRYNGKPDDTIIQKNSGFWREFSAAGGPLDVAQNAYDTVTTTEQAEAAAAVLRTAIEKLIPTEQLNATFLYETIQTENNRNLKESDYTGLSWKAYSDAKADAEAYLASLFTTDAQGNIVATEKNKARNQLDADSKAEALTAAYDGLYSQSLYELTQTELPVLKSEAAILLQKINMDGLQESNYDPVSWKKFADAYAEAIANYDKQFTSTGASFERNDLLDYRQVFSDLCKAWLLLEQTGSIQISLTVNDLFGMEFDDCLLTDPETATFCGSKTLEAGKHSIKDLFDALNWGGETAHTLRYAGSDQDVSAAYLIYINGVLVREPFKGQLPLPTSPYVYYEDVLGLPQPAHDTIQLHNNDEVVILRIAQPTESYANTHLMPVTDISQVVPYFKLLRFTTDASKLSPKEGESFTLNLMEQKAYWSTYDGRLKAAAGKEIFAYGPMKEDGTYPAEPIRTGFVTDAEGNASVSLELAGTYILTAMDLSGMDFDNHKYPGLAGGAYITITVLPLPTDELAEKKTEFMDALDALLEESNESDYEAEAWTRLGTIIADGKSAIENADKMESVQKAYDQAVSDFLAVPTIDHESILDRFVHYLKYLPSVDQISAGYFSQADIERMGWTTVLYNAMSDYQKEMLSPAQQAQYDALVSAYGTDGSSLPEFKQFTATVSVDENDLIYSEESSQLWAVYYDSTGVMNQLTGGVGFNNNNLKNGMIPKVTAGSDSRHKTDAFWLVVNISKEHYDLFDGIEIDEAEVDCFEVEELQFFYRYTYYILTPYEGFTIHIKAVELPLQQFKNAALTALETKLNGYNKDDYTEKNWAELTAAYSKGVADIKAATNEDDVTAAKQTALDEMDAVKTKSETGVLGSVKVIVENTTCKAEKLDAALKNTIIEKTVALTEQSTMMKCVLTALADAGYSWTGTGGKGYEITYLSSIYIDANGNEKPDDGEKSLAEFDAGPQSGWMGTLNDWFVNEGFNMFTVANGKLKDGDVIRVQYTVTGYGTDLGATWANNDTSLKKLTVNGGSIAPTFDDPGILEYVLTPEGGSVSLLPTAANKNFQVRIFLNQQNKNANAEYYRSGESIPVKSGDVVWIGVGEKAWGTMNDGSIVATWYKLNVVSKDDASAVIKLINAIGSITYSNYETKQNAVDLARAAYNALTSAAKSSVTNLDTLTKAEAAIAGYQKVDALKAAIDALPRNVTEDDKTDVEAAKDLYDELAHDAPDLLNLLSGTSTNKLQKAINTLKLIDALKKVSEIDFVSTKANTVAAVIGALEGELGGMKIDGKAVTVVVTLEEKDFTAADETGDGSYTASVSFTLGSGSQAATQKKTISGTIKRSSNAGIKSITVKDVPPSKVSGTDYQFTLPYGSKLAELTAEAFAIKCVDGASITAKPDATDNTKTKWAFTVTAQDGITSERYTVTLSVSKVNVTVLDSWVYYVSEDTQPVKLDASAVVGLQKAVNADALLLDEGTEEAFLWVEARQKSGDVFTITPVYAPVGKDGKADPADYLIGTYTLTLPVPGTKYAKVLFDGKYLDAAGSDSGITFAAKAGDYTLIPDAHIAIVTFHEFDGTNNRQIVFYRGDAGNDLPAASKSGAAFKGWYAKVDCTGDKFTTVSATLPTDLYPLWSYGVKTEEVGDIEDRVEVSAIVQGDVATITVESKKPCAVIVEKPDGSFERLEAFDNGDGSCSFIQKDYDADMVFYVATLGDYDENGVLEPADLTAANLTIIGDVDLEPLSAFIMGAKDGKLRTVDLAKLFLHLARNDVEW